MSKTNQQYFDETNVNIQKNMWVNMTNFETLANNECAELMCDIQHTDGMKNQCE